LICFLATLAAKAQITLVGTALEADTLVKKDTIPPKIIGSIYIELGGNALFYSLNYEHVLKTSKKYRLALRAGFGIEPQSRDTYYPLELNYLRGKKTDFLEIGIGFTPSVADWKELDFGGTKEKTFQGITTFRIGYRYISPNQRFVFRLGALLLWRSVFVNSNQERYFFYEKRNYYDAATIWTGIGENIQPWVGVSFGYNLFK